MAEPKDFRTVEFEQRKTVLFPLYTKVEFPQFAAVTSALRRPCHFHTRNFIADLEFAIADVASAGQEQLFLGSKGLENLGALWYAALPNKDHAHGTNPDYLIARYFRLCGYVAASGFWSRYNATMCISWEYVVPLDIYSDANQKRQMT